MDQSKEDVINKSTWTSSDFAGDIERWYASTSTIQQTNTFKKEIHKDTITPRLNSLDRAINAGIVGAFSMLAWSPIIIAFIYLKKKDVSLYKVECFMIERIKQIFKFFLKMNKTKALEFICFAVAPSFMLCSFLRFSNEEWTFLFGISSMFFFFGLLKIYWNKTDSKK